MDASIKQRFSTSVQWLEGEYAGIRTGQAAPALLDSIKVDSYGVRVPINQVGTVGVEDARTLRIAPWDVSAIAAIERAITEADLGVSVATDSSGVRVIFPELTSERRAQLVKLAKSKLEDARVSVRSVRDDLMKSYEKQQKAGEISEDIMRTQKDAVQKEVDATNQALEELFKAKEVEISK